MSNLEERIQRIEDRFAIEDLVSRYFMASDDNDFDVVEDSFTKDGIFTGPGFLGGSNRAEVMEFVRAFRANVGQTVHTLNSLTVEFVDAGRASGIVGAHIELSLGGRTVFGAFRYYDDYVREEGRWRFARRELLTVHVGPWEDIGTSLTCENSIRWPGSEPSKSHVPRND